MNRQSLMFLSAALVCNLAFLSPASATTYTGTSCQSIAGKYSTSSGSIVNKTSGSLWVSCSINTPSSVPVKTLGISVKNRYGNKGKTYCYVINRSWYGNFMGLGSASATAQKTPWIIWLNTKATNGDGTYTQYLSCALAPYSQLDWYGTF